MKNWVFILLAVLIGCSADATPVAVISPTAMSITSEPTSLPPQDRIYRYGVMNDVIGYEMTLNDNTTIEQIPPNADLSLYDLVIAYGIIEGWQQTPQPQRVSLLINPRLAPLDQPDILTIVTTIPRPAEIAAQIPISGLQFITDQSVDSITIRTTLANRGYPDGLNLTLAYDNPLILNPLIEQFQASRITLQTMILTDRNLLNVLNDQQAHLGVTTWINRDDRTTFENVLGSENIIDLMTIPLSYRVLDNLTVVIDERGFPIIQH